MHSAVLPMRGAGPAGILCRRSAYRRTPNPTERVHPMADASIASRIPSAGWPDPALPQPAQHARVVQVGAGRLNIRDARHRPALCRGLELLERQPLALLGFSPGNGYFSRKRVEVAIAAMAALFDEVLVVVPDTIVEHTYRALGYAETQVAAKARSCSRNLQNRCRRALELARAQYPETRLRLLDWATEVEAFPGHAQEVEAMRSLWCRHPGFRAAVFDKGREVLAAKRTDRPPTDAEVEEGVQYLLKEFAFIRRARRQLGRDLVIPYHQDFPLGQALSDGQYLPAEAGIGWLIYDIELDDAELEAGGHEH